jgi:hypothetical protein
VSGALGSDYGRDRNSVWKRRFSPIRQTLLEALEVISEQKK